jgi:transketolase
VPIEFIGLNDTYAESGLPEELFERYKLTAPHLAAAVERAVKRK